MGRCDVGRKKKLRNMINDNYQISAELLIDHGPINLFSNVITIINPYSLLTNDFPIKLNQSKQADPMAPF